MDSPSFSNYWNQPSYSRYRNPTTDPYYATANTRFPMQQNPSMDPFYSTAGSRIPRQPRPTTMDQPSYPTADSKIPMQPKSSAKVVSIPVRFVGSDSDMSPLNAALKIQKVFRGFLVRKSLRKIASIGKEVEEIERRICNYESVELIRREQKERLRIMETLMALLFKLDSVRGVDYGVRDYRKFVIRKAIALQEKLDNVVADNASDLTLDDKVIADDASDLTLDDKAIDHQTPEMMDSAMESRGQLEDSATGAQGQLEDHRIIGDYISIDNSFDCNNCSDQTTIKTEDGEKLGKIEEAKEVGDGSRIEVDEFGADWEDVENPRCDNVKEIVENCNATVETAENKRGGMEVDEEEEQKVEEDNPGDCKIAKRGSVEKMMEENEKMMRMMSQLMEKSQMQTQMLTSLTQRVEHLEKAYYCDLLHRLSKKKRQKQDARLQ